MHKLFWLVGRHSDLDLSSKRLLYISIVKAIWIYGIQLWGCVIKSNIGKIQRCQSITLHTIIAAYRYNKNDIIHRDLKMSSVQDEITQFAHKYARRLELHTNIAVI
ncbi:Hypothetical protein CINCED_3A003504 [Cinara cedri]|uniref:Uncharacterized protein n=1 Tax=Cinara cedri TaxID=506608 RepID=A0A5E4N106_9HEMI|nr:Hypothetical protein CINCED_3A003504 [Cinara cedri]